MRDFVLDFDVTSKLFIFISACIFSPFKIINWMFTFVFVAA